jgi:hypothetical protein
MNFDIIDWNPINSYNEFNLLSRIQIKPTIELLYLFKDTVDHNLLCTITETELYDKTVYGIIDKSSENDNYYIVLDMVWMEYPKKNGKVSFKTNLNIDKEEDKEDKEEDKKEDKKLLKDDNKVDNKVDNKGDIMKLSDILIPIAISLIIIGLSKYILPEKLFD